MDTYVKISSFFLILLLTVLFYFFLFPFLPSWAILPSFCGDVPEAYCPSAGLSRGIAAALRGHFVHASSHNPQALPVLFFFVVQCFMRMAVLGYSVFTDGGNSKKWEKRIIAADVLLSSVLFLFVFSPFLLFF